MTILLIRHGESEADLLNVHEGRADFELTKRGHLQAEAMSDYVTKNFKLTKIYSSTLKRAAQTAKHLSDKAGLCITLDHNLMEFNNGKLAGLDRDEAAKLYPAVKDIPIDQAVYGQESKVEFRARAEKALERVYAENYDGSVVAIVTHGGMINELYGALLHTQIGENNFFRTADTGIHVWNITERGNYITRANYNEHARDI